MLYGKVVKGIYCECEKNDVKFVIAKRQYRVPYTISKKRGIKLGKKVPT